MLVSPAPGQPGRLPFWKGDSPGRPLELGRAIGAFLREVGAASRAADARLRSDAAWTTWAADNLRRLPRRAARGTGHVPDDRTILVERFRDELGDWRVVLHSPFGAQVHAPWALALGAAARRAVRHGRAGHARRRRHRRIRADLMGARRAAPAPSWICVVRRLDKGVEQIVTDQVGGSALFASRFRECAARALLLPRRNPGKRTPLWQQRQRAAQLLDGGARVRPDFPIILEAVRECLQDVFDVPALIELMGSVAARRVRLDRGHHPKPSPFARSLLFGYVGAFLYEGDSPLAERRAAALSLDSTLLAELLGRVELRELLDPAVIEAVEQRLRWADRRCATPRTPSRCCASWAS